MNEDFTIKNRPIQIWLVTTSAICVSLALIFPPSFWLCGIGGVMLAIGMLANSARTDQWYSWQNEGSLNWFEGWAVSTAMVLIFIPLGIVMIRVVLAN